MPVVSNSTMTTTSGFIWQLLSLRSILDKSTRASSGHGRSERFYSAWRALQCALLSVVVQGARDRPLRLARGRNVLRARDDVKTELELPLFGGRFTAFETLLQQ